jgi:hypothetical protein
MPRARRNPWRVGLGWTGSLLAAALVVLLIATLVLGVRVWRDRSFLNPSPAVPAIDEVELARLKARPLILPFVLPGGTCPTAGYHLVSYLGANPHTDIFGGRINVTGKGLEASAAGLAGQATSKWGKYYDPVYSADRKLKGIVLIRIRDLMTGEAGIFVGPYAAGDVVGTDTIDGNTVEQHNYAVLDLSHPPVASGNYFGIWHIRQGWPAGWSGCWGVQLDGADFSEVYADTTPTAGK